MKLNALKLRTKIGLIVGLMAVPTAILGTIYVDQARKDAVFAEQEIAGVDYQRGVWAAIGSLTKAASDGQNNPASFLDKVPDLKALGTALDGTFGTGSAASTFNADLDALGWPNRTIPRGTDVKATIEHGQTLMTAIADGSNLTLDPDLDTFYLMASTTTHQVDMIFHSSQIMTQAFDLKAKGNVEASDLAGLMLQVEMFKDAVGQVGMSMKSAIANNSDATLNASLGGLAGALQANGQKFAEVAADAARKLGAGYAAGSVDLAPLAEARSTLVKSNNELWQQAGSDLGRLLRQRIDAINTALWSMLAVVGAVILAALGLAVFIARQTTTSFSRMIGIMDRVARDDFEAEVEGRDRGDEIGQIARAVEVFKDKGLEVAELTANYKGQVNAIHKAQAVIEFDLTGKVLDANDHFLSATGYSLDEIKSQHHSMFVDPAYRQSADYRVFWEKLGRGEYDAGQYKRLGKGGRELWLQASYNPIVGLDGKPYKVVKYATDITGQKQSSANYEGQIAAIRKAQAVIEFDLSGTILDANDNFLTTVGYGLAEIKGQHHSMFVDVGHRSSVDYKMFWEKLGRGEYDAGRYMRIGKGGKVVWIQASYNPILDADGKPYKVVKFATDVTAEVEQAEMLQRAVRDSQKVVAAAKDNDLCERIDLEGMTGEIVPLCEGINGLLDTMSEMVAGMIDASRAVSDGAAEITSGTNDLSQRTEQQASNLEETSASMEEMAATIRQNADNAQQANQLVINARSLAAEGGDVVGKAVDAMSRIEGSSQKISDIIGVIDEIAFQTNLLALNAAVEAARAGDAGKGFAVVASEVRSLAQRSSEAAKDIKGLIVESGSQVKDGVKLVNNAGESLSEIVGSVKKVADIVSEIAAASREQATGVEEINKAVSQMDEMTQQNSALVEENAAACRMLQDQAETMSERMSQFRINGMEASVARAPAPRQSAPAPVRAAEKPRPRKVAARGNGAVKLQADLATAFADDADWKEF
ncbi:Dipeptide chemoreceptor protein [Hartmannibacter diazotrophicus]|uniref:Dipeptide chemoreceptor protein n=1 Tax=Hartmannibacter diazotrophicus TaxID=1482074 RepID=A0A2C9DDT3_9HYPH|nr:methyl-accepting chemotaxis protein [Hartmannibacter diazotrophicus]SON58258.1 Dipeptide chemoreceptor protein [Hartmannibacter diazotrophicus]